MKKLLLTTLAVLFFLLVKTVNAQSSWIINSFDSKISVEKNGKVLITESIDLNFNDLEKHGIYRDIPFVYNKNGTKLYTKVNVLKVERNGKKEKYDLSNNRNNLRIRIGDPDITISGPQKYLLSYEAIGVLSSYKDFNELYWNVTGNDWEVPISSATAKITVPNDSIKNAACYEGVIGSNKNCQTTKNAGSAEFAAAEPLYPSEGLTIAVGFEKGLVPILSGKTFYNKLQEIPFLWVIGIFFLPIIFCFLILIRKWHQSGRDLWWNKEEQATKLTNKDGPTVVEYEAPDGLRPAEIGVLIDEKADTRDITSTIIDLAVRGFLTIKEIKKNWVFGKNDYELSKKNKNTKELLRYESLLLTELFESGNTIKISSLKYKFYSDLVKVKEELYQEVVNKKLFPKSPDKVRSSYLIIAILIIVASGIVFFVAISSQIIAFIAFTLGITLSGIVTLVFSRFMPQRTAHGYELYKRALGYRLFIDKAERYKQKFFERKNLINEVLPYTIVFGMTEKFAEAMKELGFEKQMGGGFYYGGSYTSFSSSVNTFSSSMSSAISSAPSSSGSSGGGSSGGGFGGGGGGSW